MSGRATNLLPGPASTQLAICCGWRVAAAPGALLGGIGFILPGLALIIALAALFLTGIIGSAIPLTLALEEWWQFAILAGAVLVLFALRRGVVLTLLTAGSVGALAGLAGAPLPSQGPAADGL